MGRNKRALKKDKTRNHHDRPGTKKQSVARQQSGSLSSTQKANLGKKLKQKRKQNGKVQQQRLNVPFDKYDRVLLVGEGDFSFAKSLARYYQVGNIIATSYDDGDELIAKHPGVERTLRQLDPSTVNVDPQNRDQKQDIDGFTGFSDDEADLEIDEQEFKTRSAKVLHGIDATRLSQTHKKQLNPHAPFTKIVFNFPHVGGLSTDINRQVRANQELLVSFFKSAVPLLASAKNPVSDLKHNSVDVTTQDGSDVDIDNGSDLDPDEHANRTDTATPARNGNILVSIFEGEPYTLWNIRDLARHCGLQVIESFKFPWEAYPGYKHARTIGDIVTGKDRDGERRGKWRGEERDARCYVFGVKEQARRGGQKATKRKTGNDSDSD